MPQNHLPRRLASVVVVLTSLVGFFVVGCGPPSVQAGRPEIAIQGYKLATAPSASAEHFLGRRYEQGAGGLGDKPCALKDLVEAESNQRMSATFDSNQLLNLDLNKYQIFGAGASLSGEQLQGLRLELTTTRRAAVTVDNGCKDPVIYDVVAGELYVEYQFSRSADVKAKADTHGIEVGGQYKVDEGRSVISTTLKSDQYIAFKAHAPKDNTYQALGLMVGGALAFAVGIGADVALARDQVDDILEYIPLVLYIGGAGAGIYGYSIWGE